MKHFMKASWLRLALIGIGAFLALAPIKASATTPCSFFPCGNPYGGVSAPQPIAGISMGTYPYGYYADATSAAMVANTVYYVPFPVFQTTTFAGSQVHDIGSGNNGMHIRTALYAQSATGGPGALLKDFGAVSLTGTAALHQAANSVTVSGPQMCYVAIVSDSTPSMATIGLITFSTNVGRILSSPIASMLGDIGGNTLGALNGMIAPIVGWNASLAYGAFPGTATAPSANTTTSSGAGSPGIELYY